MKKATTLLLMMSLPILCMALTPTNPVKNAGGRKTCIDRGWHFFLGNGEAALTNVDVAARWRLLDLPHDWSVETEAAQKAGGTVVGPFSSNSVGKYQTGHTVGGVGWYMKSLRVEKGRLKMADKDYPLAHSLFTLYFEGAYNQSEVYLNGQKLHFNPYGYSSFRVDITDVLRPGDNTLLVRVANEGNNSRWYAGSGIYRHVWLIHTPKTHLDDWDLFVRTSAKEDGSWQVDIDAPYHRETQKGKKPTLRHILYDAQGQEVAQTASQDVSQQLSVGHPQLWSPDHPYRYKLKTQLLMGRKVVDELVTNIGFRSLRFTSTDGFLLNGQPTLMRGGCIHHDNGLLGAAAYDRAEDRKIEILKAQGYNAVRCSHNIPSVHFLDACDSLGMMVIDEAFDQWLMEKNKDDYHRFFAEYSDKDIEMMVRRDRNHPSVILWSIGNEIPGRIEPEGLKVAERLRQDILRLDTTRPITAAICGWDAGDTWNAAGHNWEQQDGKAFESLDVGGYNYLFNLYERDHGIHPGRVMMGTESYPKQMSQNWDAVERHPYVVGDFIWTAVDYLGEAGIGSASIRKEGQQAMFQDWPWYNGWCGDIDIIGQKKPQSYYHDVVWRQAPIAMAVERPIPAGHHQSISAWGWQLEEHNWTYPDLTEKDTLSVNVYSRAPQVRLYLNGECVGEKAPTDTYWTCFHVAYKPGTLHAVNLDAEGKELTTQHFELHTTGRPAAIRLTADRNVIRAGEADLAYVTIELVDAEGRVVTSNNEWHVQLSAEGDGTLLCAGNASPIDMESFRSTRPKLFQGRALAIVKSGDTVGSIRLRARVEGLPETTIDIQTNILENL